jgi:co-chaperonin GroES (HSP10)
MKPLRDNLLVAEIKEEKENKSEGGIILTAEVKDQSATKAGLVIAVGPDVVNVKQGDQVYLRWSEGIKVIVDKLEAALVPEDAVKAIR